MKPLFPFELKCHLIARVDVEIHPPVSWYLQVNTATEQMEDTAQLFLGLRIQCARCHHHPFEQWSHFKRAGPAIERVEGVATVDLSSFSH